MLVSIGCALFAVQVITGLLPGGDTLYVHWLSSALILASAGICAMRARLIGRESSAWAAMAAALLVYFAGDTYWNLQIANDPAPPFPSPADAGWLLFYLPAFAALALLIKGRRDRVRVGELLDGLVAALAVAAIAAGTILAPILTSEGSSSAEVITNGAYPVGDLVLLTMVGAALLVVGRDAGRGWWMLAGGLGLFAISDVLYLFQNAADSYSDGDLIDIGWPLASVLIAWSAWEPMASLHSEEESRIRTEQSMVAAFALMAVIVLVADLATDVSPFARILAIATLGLIIVRLAIDARQARQIEEDRHRLSRTDDLTGLPNRRHFEQRLDADLEHLRDIRGTSALLLMDLDHFKEINDSLGHAAGDVLLREAAERLRRVVPADAFVARLGGDEFVVMPAPGATAADAVDLAERIRASFAVPTQVAGVLCHLSASTGVALTPEHAKDGSGLLRRADIAMYAAKRSGSGVCLFDPEQEQFSKADVELIGDLRRGISRGELELNYHPIAAIGNGDVHCVETVLRWQHPHHGLLMPDQFLGLAERHGLMTEITDAVLDEALRQQSRWQARGIGLRVAVNLSGPDLLDPGFPDRVRAALAKTGAAPDHLCFEITEDVVMLDPERVLASLHAIEALGIPMALDDYGTGHASLAYLKRLPVSKLKIDRSFVQEMTTDPKSAVIVASTVDLAHRLGMTVVAEGVETDEHWRELAGFGCDDAQGFLLTKPIAAAQFEEWLAVWEGQRARDAA